MSMFNKIKGLFIVEDENVAGKEKTDTKLEKSPNRSGNENINGVEKAQDVTKQTIQTQTQTKQASTTANIDNSTTKQPEVDPAARQKFFDIFLKAIDDNNQEGFDYLEFKNALQNLSSMNMDDATRYKSAMAMAQTMNVSTGDIVNSATKYIEVLKQEESKFMTVVKKQKEIKVTGAEQALQDKIKGIEAKKQRILDLQKEIEAETAQLDTEKQKIIAENNKLNTTYLNFKSAYDAVTGQIFGDIENLKKFVD